MAALDQSNLNIYIFDQEFQTDRFYPAGKGEETFAPHFTYHGFRYAEIELNGSIELKSISCCVIHTDLRQRGSFECSEPVLNEIQSCAKNSMLTNYHGIPTDCPHREKNGWSGDAMFVSEALLYNFEASAAYEKWMNDFADVQLPSGHLPGIILTSGWSYTAGSGTAWDSAFILIPWYSYIYDGDLEILKSHYPQMQRLMDYNSAMSDGYIVYHGLGDHSMTAGSERKVSFMESCYFLTSAKTMAKIAEVLKLPQDRQKYQELAKKIQSAMENTFADTATGMIGDGTQAELACALYHGVVKNKLKNMTIERLIEKVRTDGCKIQGGVMAAKALLRVLCENGHEDMAYSIATRTEYPSWGFMTLNGGKTLWEGWEDENSHNHQLLSDISAWFYSYLAGISPDPDSPGFHHFYLRPYFPKKLSWVKAHIDSVSGLISSEWQRVGDEIRMKAIIPPNTSATVFANGYIINSVTELISEKCLLKDIDRAELLAGSYEMIFKQSQQHI